MKSVSIYLYLSYNKINSSTSKDIKHAKVKKKNRKVKLNSLNLDS